MSTDFSYPYTQPLWCKCACGKEFYATAADAPAMQQQANAHIADCDAVKRGDWITRWGMGELVLVKDDHADRD